MRRPLLLCCSSDVLVIFYEGQLWFRRHEWNADQWAPLDLPGATSRRTRTTETVVTTRRRKGSSPKQPSRD